MGDVIPFGSPKPHQSGDAECGACGHHWVAVAPVGYVHFDCPQCKRAWGTMRNAIEPSVGQSMWRCRCGESLFFIVPDGCLCRRCGQIQAGVW